MIAKRPDEAADVSIIVVNWNTRQLLERCLDSIRAGTGGGVTAQTIVVDNGSTDGSPQLVREQFPEVALIANSENRGFAVANNQGIRRSTGRYLFLLNSDAALRAGSAQALLAYAREHREAGILGPKLLNPDGTLQPSGGCLPTLRSALRGLFGLDRLGGAPRYGTRRDYSRATEVEEVSGAAMFIARPVIDSVGDLDERYAWGYEDVDLCLRARRAGWQIHYVPSAEVQHDWGGSRRLAPASTTLKAISGRYWYFRKNVGRAQAVVVILATYLSHALRLILFTVGGLGKPAWRERARIELAVTRGLLMPRR